ncbi:MAG: transporter [Proteobacteria bacterium]|nr:transporter [Pseudomonadota bacterium]
MRRSTSETAVAVNGDGNRGRASAIGPYFTYVFSKKFTLSVKVQSEFNVRNRPEGTRLWLQTRIDL